MNSYMGNAPEKKKSGVRGKRFTRKMICTEQKMIIMHMICMKKNKLCMHSSHGMVGTKFHAHEKANVRGRGVA